MQWYQEAYMLVVAPTHCGSTSFVPGGMFRSIQLPCRRLTSSKPIETHTRTPMICGLRTGTASILPTVFPLVDVASKVASHVLARCNTIRKDVLDVCPLQRRRKALFTVMVMIMLIIPVNYTAHVTAQYQACKCMQTRTAVDEKHARNKTRS